MKFLIKPLFIFLITIFLFTVIDFFLGHKVFNFFVTDNKSVIEHQIYHHNLEKNLNRNQLYRNKFSYKLCTNEFGFKKSCEKQNKQNKIIDYAFIGDSFVESVGINFEDTFVGKFAKFKSDKEVVNLGVGSYTPKIYYAKINDLLIKDFKFKNIILFIDISDIYNENQYYIKNDKFIYVKRHNAYNYVNTIFKDYSSTYKIKKILRFYLPLSYFLYANITHKLEFGSEINPTENNPIREIPIDSRWTFKNEYSNLDNYWIKNGIKESLFYMNKIYSLSKNNDFDISVAVYPWPSQILFDEDTGQEQVDIWSKFCEGKCKYFLNYIEDFHKLKKQENSNKIVTEFFLENDVHFNKRGNQLVFKKLSNVFN